MSEEKKSKMLNAFTMLFVIITLIAVLTWIIPAGQYDFDADGQILAGTYKAVEQNPQGIWDIISAPIKGFLGTDDTDGAVQISLFILIVGGFLNVVTQTGAIDAGISSVIKTNKDNMSRLIWILMFIFALGGSTYGMAEETIPFYVILIPMMINVGMDAVVAVGVVLIGSGLGVLSSTVNPFATGAAATMAGIGIEEGIMIRVIFFIVTYIIGAWYVSSYAKKVQEDPKNSVIYDKLEEHKKHFKMKEVDSITSKQKVVLTLFALTFATMILGLIPWHELNENWTFFMSVHETLINVPFIGNLIGSTIEPLGTWYLVEISVLFFLMSVIIGLYYGFSEEELINTFIDGAKDLISVALIVAVARGIQVVMNDGNITATVLHWGENGLKGLSSGVFIVLTYLFYIPMTFLIVSTSGLAAATMGIMSSLGEFANVPKHLIVTAYQASSGVVNLIAPTSGVVMGALAIAKFDLGTWIKFTWKLQVMVVIASLAILVGAAYLL